jgi:hypothetical protein
LIYESAYYKGHCERICSHAVTATKGLEGHAGCLGLLLGQGDHFRDEVVAFGVGTGDFHAEAAGVGFVLRRMALGNEHFPPDYCGVY